MTDALLCAGDWDSTIKGEPDGFFTLKLDFATGDLTGVHFDEDGQIHLAWGSCEHQEGHHRIELWEFHESFAYRYFGEIIPDAGGRHKTKDGKRRTLRPILRPERRQDDDDWVGTHST